MQQIRGQREFRPLLQILLVDVIDLLIVSDDQICVISTNTLQHALLLQRDLLLQEQLVG